jgi:hypothetical protein
MQPQLFLAAQNLGGAPQRAMMNVVKHSPSPSGCHFNSGFETTLTDCIARRATSMLARKNFFRSARLLEKSC